VSLRLRLGGGLVLADILACSRSAPYDCVITPRFPEAASILTEERVRFEN